MFCLDLQIRRGLLNKKMEAEGLVSKIHLLCRATYPLYLETLSFLQLDTLL